MNKFAVFFTIFLIPSFSIAQENSTTEKNVVKQKSNTTVQTADSSYSLSSGTRQQPTVLQGGVQVTGHAENASVQDSTSATENNSTETTIEQYDVLISSIETKIDWVKSNPDEHQKALASGWYDQMNQKLSEFKKARQELINKQNSK